MAHLDVESAHDTYACADGRWLAVGPIEPQFYALPLEECGIDDARFARQRERAQLLALKAALSAVFPIRARKTYLECNGLTQPAPAPRFSRTRSEIGAEPFTDNARDTRSVLLDWGLGRAPIDALSAAGVI